MDFPGQSRVLPCQRRLHASFWLPGWAGLKFQDPQRVSKSDIPRLSKSITDQPTGHSDIVLGLQPAYSSIQFWSRNLTAATP